MRKSSLIALFITLIGIAAHAAPPSPITPNNQNSVSFRIITSIGMGENLGIVGVLSGITVGNMIFGEPDYFQDIGRSYVISSPRINLGFEYLFSEKNAVKFELGYEQRIFKFSFLKNEAPSDLDYCSDFALLGLSFSYEWFLIDNGYFGIGFGINTLLANDSKIIYDDAEYASQFEDASSSTSIYFDTGKNYAFGKGHELRVNCRLFCDVSSMYPLKDYDYASMLFFAGVSINISWAIPIAYR